MLQRWASRRLRNWCCLYLYRTFDADYTLVCSRTSKRGSVPNARLTPLMRLLVLRVPQLEKNTTSTRPWCTGRRPSIAIGERRISVTSPHRWPSRSCIGACETAMLGIRQSAVALMSLSCSGVVTWDGRRLPSRARCGWRTRFGASESVWRHASWTEQR